jgi:hypothetical protein
MTNAVTNNESDATGYVRAALAATATNVYLFKVSLSMTLLYSFKKLF